MTTLLASSTATSAAATEGNVKTYLSNLRDYIADLLGTDSSNKSAALMAMGSALNSSSSKTGTYTVIQSDRGKVITCSGTFTLNLQAAATLGDGFVFGVWNTGSGVITIDPNLSETIDGAITKTIVAGKFSVIYCNGSSFAGIGSFDTGPGSGLNADMVDGKHASEFALTGEGFSWVSKGSHSVAFNGYLDIYTLYGSGLYVCTSSNSGWEMPSVQSVTPFKKNLETNGRDTSPSTVTVYKLSKS